MTSNKLKSSFSVKSKWSNMKNTSFFELVLKLNQLIKTKSNANENKCVSKLI